MAINEFETRTILFLAIKYLNKAKVRGISKYGDLEIFDVLANSKTLVEVKAGGTSGKNLKAEVTGGRVLEAADQLENNSGIYDNRIIYCSGLTSEYSAAIKTEDPFINIPSLHKIAFFPKLKVLKGYKASFDDFLLCSYDSSGGKQYPTIISEQKQMIKSELAANGISFNEAAFDVIEDLLKRDVESGLIFNDKTISILFSRTLIVSFGVIENFAITNGIGKVLSKGKLDDAILNLNKDDLAFLSYRTNLMSDKEFIDKLQGEINETIGWDIEKIIFLSYISSKEKQW